MQSCALVRLSMASSCGFGELLAGTYPQCRRAQSRKHRALHHYHPPVGGTCSKVNAQCGPSYLDVDHHTWMYTMCARTYRDVRNPLYPILDCVGDVRDHLQVHQVIMVRACQHAELVIGLYCETNLYGLAEVVAAALALDDKLQEDQEPYESLVKITVWRTSELKQANVKEPLVVSEVKIHLRRRKRCLFYVAMIFLCNWSIKREKRHHASRGHGRRKAR
eukprot:7577888-Pyramimonas_sp.AAC.1